MGMQPAAPSAYVDVMRLQHMDVKERQGSVLLAVSSQMPQETIRKSAGSNDEYSPDWVIVVHLLADGRWIRHRERCLELHFQDPDALRLWVAALLTACPALKLVGPVGA